MSTQPRPRRLLEAWPCQSICVWTATGVVWRDSAAGDLQVFRCAGCASEWVRTERWTPIDAAGLVPPEVAAERGR